SKHKLIFFLPPYHVGCHLLFSCFKYEAWGELSRRCPFQSEPPGASLDSLWDAMPVTCQEDSAWSRETGPCSLSSLIQDLSLSDAKGSQTTAPPSKRQCRSLSLSEELNSCRTAWRPIGSRIWTPVEKRRCHSGGSVQRCSNGFSGITMQRSSSFSLPARSNTFPGTFPRVCDQVCIPQGFGSQTFQGFQESSTITGSGAEREELEPPRSLSLSHEQISTSDYQSPSARSTPDSTPELERRVRSGGLSRSRSQPCVLNDKKIGMKRRRPEEVLEQRPSLDLAKMTQVSTGNLLSLLMQFFKNYFHVWKDNLIFGSFLIRITRKTLKSVLCLSLITHFEGRQSNPAFMWPKINTEETDVQPYHCIKIGQVIYLNLKAVTGRACSHFAAQENSACKLRSLQTWLAQKSLFTF
uniref:Family with sequence similarity 53 member B n=1 Tax=Erpetoichthys calabaricus TaxID=27687 RepID=A0A8C4SB98_ERPCA